MSLAPELGAGPLDAPLWLVGRDYGSEEALKRQPFVGQAGTILDSALKAAGLVRTEGRVDNLVPRQPPANDFARHDPTTLAWGQERLATLLRQYKPTVIVAFGNEVCKFLIGDAWPSDGIQACRGYLWDTQYGRVLASTHPAAILYKGQWVPWRALLDLDLRRARAELELGAPPLVQRKVTTCTDPSDIVILRCAIASAAPPLNSLLSVDIENTHDLQLACVGFAPTPECAWVIPAVEGWQLSAIRALCESDVPKVLQNGQYDRFFLRRFAGITLRNQAFDVMLGWHALNPELAGKKAQVGHRKPGGRHTVKSLKFLSSIYTRDRWWKSYDFQTEDERYTLCGRDVCITLDIAQKQITQLEAT